MKLNRRSKTNMCHQSFPQNESIVQFFSFASLWSVYCFVKLREESRGKGTGRIFVS